MQEKEDQIEELRGRISELSKEIASLENRLE